MLCSLDIYFYFYWDCHSNVSTFQLSSFPFVREFVRLIQHEGGFLHRDDPQWLFLAVMCFVACAVKSTFTREVTSQSSMTFFFTLFLELFNTMFTGYGSGSVKNNCTKRFQCCPLCIIQWMYLETTVYPWYFPAVCTLTNIAHCDVPGPLHCCKLLCHNRICV